MGFSRANRNPELSLPEAIVFGDDAKLHPITNLPLEQGVGALSPRLQAYRMHLPLIEQRDGKEAAAAMRKRLEDADKFVAAQTGMAAAKNKLASDGVSASAAEKGAT